MKTFSYHLLTMVLALLVSACANQGNPSGGPRDVTPPVLVKSRPALNEKNYSEPKIQLTFDEIVVLKDMTKYFIVSPPLQEDPEIKALAKKVVIDLKNELQPNTTYTIYMGSSIVDNNEGNALADFTFSFSTGEVVDSMMLSGTILRAMDLEPQAGVIVGIYKTFEDSAFIQRVPLRIARTNSEGSFAIKNIAPGNYKIYALKEPVRNYKFDPGEELAFIDSVYTPIFDTIQVSDTLWVDSVTVDSIIWKDTLVYGPDNILLQLFDEFHLFQNLRKKERSLPYQFLFSFSSKIQEEPRLHILGTPASYGAYFSEYSVTGDTVLFWLTDSTVYQKDTLLVELEYQKTDSIEQLFWQKDTIQMIFRKPREPRKSKNKSRTPVVKSLKINHNLGSNLDLEGKVTFAFDEPIARFNAESIKLYINGDTLKKQLPFDLERDKAFPRRFYLKRPWVGGEEYAIEIDSAAISNIYGNVSDKLMVTFGVRKIDEYGNITFTLEKPNLAGELLMLNGQGKTLRTQAFSANQNSIGFKLILPGKYYFKLYFDENENGQWDTGNYLEHKQPEPVRFFQKVIDIKAYRDYEEDWNTEALKLWEQKPKELIGLEEKKR